MLCVLSENGRYTICRAYPSGGNPAIKPVCGVG
jgi:hypothetical protein